MTNRFLISVAAAALIAGTGFANAQGAGTGRDAGQLVPRRSRARLRLTAAVPRRAAQCNAIAARPA